MNTSPSTAHCSRCGRLLTEMRLEGVCPVCLWREVFDEHAGGNGADDASERTRILAATSLVPIPGYLVREEIARGGMGIVYRAEQLEPSRTVALKMLLPHQLGSCEMRERFRLEARAAVSLEHPAILPIYQLGETDGIPWFTMKFAGGGTLAERKAALNGHWRDIAALVATLADAVHFAHGRGVLHRDLKPGNVLFDEAGRAYVSDFGLAKIVDSDTQLTRSMALLGTPHYVAPEVAMRSAKEATTASDIYSLGAILYELLAGRPPFEADGVPALLKKIVEDDVESLDRSTIPRDLEVVCLKCLAKEPFRRYASARELADDLRRWLRREPVEARPVRALERCWFWMRRHKTVAALTAAVLILIVTLAVGSTIAALRIAQSRDAALRTVEALSTHRAVDMLRRQGTAEAIAHLARRVRDYPHSRADVERLLNALQRRNWAVPVQQPFVHQEQPSDGSAHTQVRLATSTDGRPVAVFVSSNLTVCDLTSGTVRHVWPLGFSPGYVSAAPEAERLALVDPGSRMQIFDYAKGDFIGKPVSLRPSTIATSLLLSRNGRKAFVTKPDNSGCVWDIETGEALTIVPPPGPEQNIQSDPTLAGVFFSDHERIAVADHNHVVRIIHLGTGRQIGSAMQLPEPVTALGISEDGETLSARTRTSVSLWRVETGTLIGAPVTAGLSLGIPVFHPAQPELFIGASPQGLVSIDTRSGAPVKTLATGTLNDGGLVVELSGLRAACTFGDGAVGIYEVSTGKPVCEPLFHSRTHAAATRFIGGTDQFATAGGDSLAVLWRVTTNSVESRVLRHLDAVQIAHFSPDGKRVVTASYDGTARIWDSLSGRQIGPALAHSNRVWSACFSPDGRRVATASWDKSARLWDAGTGGPLGAPLPAANVLFHAEFSRDGSKLLTAGESVVRLYDGRTGQATGIVLEHKTYVYWASFSPDGKTIVTRPQWAPARVWDAATGRVLHELPGPAENYAVPATITKGEFSRDGRWLVLGSQYRHATVWRLPEGNLHAVLPHLDVVRFACLSPDDGWVLTGSEDRTARRWHLAAGQPASAPLEHQRGNQNLWFSGDGVKTGAISPDGLRVATGGSDGTARLWDAATGLPLGEPMQHEGPVLHVEFSPEGDLLLTTSMDGTARLWPVPMADGPAPEWLPALAEGLVGRGIDSSGVTQPVSALRLWDTCERIREAPAHDACSAWAKRFLGRRYAP